MALDESSDAEKDLTQDFDGLRFAIEKADAEAAGPLTIDFVQDGSGEGFVIRPDQVSESACSTCSSCGH